MNEKGRSLVSFTKMNKYYLIPFITPLFCFTCNFLSKSMSSINTELNFLFFPILYSIIDIITGLIYYIYLSKNKNKNLNSKSIKKKKINNCKIFCIIIFMSILICSKFILANLNKEFFLFLPFSLYLIFSILFSIFLFKINIY